MLPVGAGELHGKEIGRGLRVSGRSKIEWTDRTWNVVTGCTKVSAGCANCYAERMTKRFWPDKDF